MNIKRRRFLHLAAGAAVPLVSPAAARGQGTVDRPNVVVERSHYYAKPGLLDALLDLRLQACRVRVSLGLPAGEVYVKRAGGDGSGPDVAWQCTFADEAALQADLAVRAASPEIKRIRVEAKELYVRFELQVFSIAAL